MDKYTVEGYWDCHYCNAKGIRGRHRECPNCGKPRGEETRFYLKEFGEEYAVDESPADPDWLCEYCSSYNPSTAKQCLSCGAQRSGRDYSDVRGLKRSAVQDVNSNGIDDAEEISDEEREMRNLRQDRDDLAAKEEKHRQEWHRTSHLAGEKDAPNHEQNKKRISRKFIIGAFGVVAAVAVLIYALMPKHVEFQVSDISWQRSVHIEERYTAEDSGWKLPAEGRLVRTSQEVHHTDHVLDHYETYYDEVSKEVIDHYETRTEKVDKGNGFFDIEKSKVPIYKTVKEKVKKERPVYRDVPVYATRYYYLIERWKSSRSIDTAAHDKNPVWGEVLLADGQPPYDVGKERESGRRTQFFVTGIVDGEEKTYIVDDEEFWNEMNVGDTVAGAASANGHLSREK